MSDVSVLSHEYQAASELSQQLDRSLIALKKARLSGQASGQADLAELEAHRLQLANVAESLALLLDPASGHQLSEAAARVPGTLVARLRAERAGDLGYFLEDLREVSGRLRQCPDDISESDIALLDQVAAAADAETTRVFRRLMRT